MVFERPLRLSATSAVGLSKQTPENAEQRRGAIPRRGWRGAREGSWLAYTHRIPIPTLDVHAIDRYLWVGELLGFNDDPPDLKIHLPSEAIFNVQQLLEQHGVPADMPLIVLVPGTIWETKHWTIEGFAGVAREFLRERFAVVLAGTKRDQQRCRPL